VKAVDKALLSTVSSTPIHTAFSLEKTASEPASGGWGYLGLSGLEEEK